ncbi:hypothetical protein Gohar_020440 [Gossypium harknessii]|uniref:Embryo surrounding factor 1 brassicaceae domain-containing protein n=2 Tax=Gossypium TaxID=3633 RepID=A0A7J8VTX9_9ROSI|nr:hypothetical protein [Gossypium klotzschianum]MBA0814624.1 hypothetical protein [Gossypium harknessii]
MVKWLMITWIFALIFSNVVQASNRLSVGFEPPNYLVQTGCNNDCDTACCNCDIERQPPMCTYCCKEEMSATAKQDHKNGLKFSRP